MTEFSELNHNCPTCGKIFNHKYLRSCDVCGITLGPRKKTDSQMLEDIHTLLSIETSTAMEPSHFHAFARLAKMVAIRAGILVSSDSK